MRQHRPVQRELADIAPRRFVGPARRGMVGLEIDDQDLVFGDHEAVDLPGYQRRPAARPLQPADDRDFGAAAGGEHRRETRICNQGQRAFGQRLPFLLGPAIGVAGQIGQRGLAAARGRDIGQRLQQPVHQRAALQGAGALRERFGRA